MKTQRLPETWIDVPGYEGKLQASSLGRLRSLRVLNPSPSKSTGYPVISVPGTSSKKNGRTLQEHRHVHALIALAFIGPRPEGYHVNHIDGDRANSHPSNLEYVTPLENYLHSIKIGNRKKSISDADVKRVEDWYFNEGISISEVARRLNVNRKTVKSLLGKWRATVRRKEKNPHEIKLSYEDAEKIREMYTTGNYTQIQIARMFNCDPGHVSRIVNNKMWPSGKEPRYKRRSKDGNIQSNPRNKG